MNGLDTVSEADPPVTAAIRQPPVLTQERVRQTLLVISAAWLFISSLSIWRCTWDDSYIIFRYAQNLVNGLGIVFNTGQKVEGYTSFLWVLALAGATKLSVDPILASKALGLLLNLSILLAGYFLCRLMATDKAPMHGMALLLVASNAHFILTSVVGLETPLFTTILCWGLVAYLKAFRAVDQQSQARWWTGTSLLFGLLVMARPDAALTYFFLWLYTVRKFQRQPRVLILFTLPFLLMYAPYFLWRWHYYGFLFPNTFYVKSGGSLALFAKGATQTAKFLGYQTGGWFLSGLVGLVVLLFPVAETTVLGLAILSRVTFELWSGGVTPGEFRFLLPALPLIWILAERVLVRGLGTFGTRPRARLVLAGTCAFLMALQVVAFRQFREQNVGPAEMGMERAHVALGKWLGAHAPPNSTVAVGDIGAIGFWSHRKILDLDGLTDTYISHLPGAYAEKQDSQYVLRQAPNFIALRTSNCTPRSHDVSYAMDRAVFSNPQFRGEYAPVNCWEFWPKYDLLLYQRNSQAGDLGKRTAALQEQ